MNKKDKDNIEASSETSNTADNKERRDALKKTLAAGGVTMMASTWTRPVVESIVVPAHAQTSTISLIATITF